MESPPLTPRSVFAQPWVRWLLLVLFLALPGSVVVSSTACEKWDDVSSCEEEEARLSEERRAECPVPADRSKKGPGNWRPLAIAPAVSRSATPPADAWVRPRRT